MYPISDVALAIMDNIEIPADIAELLNTFTVNINRTFYTNSIFVTSGTVNSQPIRILTTSHRQIISYIPRHNCVHQPICV